MPAIKPVPDGRERPERNWREASGETRARNSSPFRRGRKSAACGTASRPIAGGTKSCGCNDASSRSNVPQTLGTARVSGRRHRFANSSPRFDAPPTNRRLRKTPGHSTPPNAIEETSSGRDARSSKKPCGNWSARRGTAGPDISPQGIARGLRFAVYVIKSLF